MYTRTRPCTHHVLCTRTLYTPISRVQTAFGYVRSAWICERGDDRLAMADPHVDGSPDGWDGSLSGGRTDVLSLAGAPHGARLTTHNTGAPVGTASETDF